MLCIVDSIISLALYFLVQDIFFFQAEWAYTSPRAIMGTNATEHIQRYRPGTNEEGGC